MVSKQPVGAPQAGAAIPRINVLGVGISAINLPLALDVVAGWVQQRQRAYVCVTPVHSVMDYQTDAALRRIANASGLTTPDGMPLVWLSRLLGYAWVGRVYGPDLLAAVCDKMRVRGCRHFFYGGAPGVAEEVARRLSTLFPGLEVAGTLAPPLRAVGMPVPESEIAQINAARADIVWVGLGSPKQEYWMKAQQARLEAPVLIGVGAAFDFAAGRQRQAPRIVQRSGFEWLYRLVQHPRRLARRYIINNPRFVGLLLAQLLGWRAYSLE